VSIITNIPFKVKPLPIPDGLTYFSEEMQLRVETKLLGRTWTVVAIKPNEGILRDYNNNPVTNIWCELYLLITEGESPVWYPDFLCRAVGGK